MLQANAPPIVEERLGEGQGNASEESADRGLDPVGLRVQWRLEAVELADEVEGHVDDSEDDGVPVVLLDQDHVSECHLHRELHHWDHVEGKHADPRDSLLPIVPVQTFVDARSEENPEHDGDEEVQGGGQLVYDAGGSLPLLELNSFVAGENCKHARNIAPESIESENPREMILREQRGNSDAIWDEQKDPHDLEVQLTPAPVLDEVWAWLPEVGGICVLFVVSALNNFCGRGFS